MTIWIPTLLVFVALLGWRGLVAGAVVALIRRAWPRARSTRPELGSGDVESLALVVLIGLRAGLSIPEALDRAGSALGPVTHRAVSDVLRRSRPAGLALALAETTGPLGQVTVPLARSVVTGASPGAALAGWIDARRSEERARVLQAAKTLPVRLTGPISLLLLPGFIALVVAPSLAGHVERRSVGSCRDLASPRTGRPPVSKGARREACDVMDGGPR